MTPFITLVLREVHRFLKLWMDTLISPVISTLLFLSVFLIITKGADVEGIPYLAFVFSGLITMNVILGSFNNPAFALVIAKNMGTLVDLQVAPIRPHLVALAYALAGMLRAVIILLVTMLTAVWLLPDVTWQHPLLALGAILLSGLQFGLVGTLFGIWAGRFESLPFITSFILQPLTFLGGTFYPLKDLPPFLAELSMLNPIHHNINLVRSLLLGYSDVDPWISFWVLTASLPVLTVLAGYVMHRKLRG